MSKINSKYTTKYYESLLSTKKQLEKRHKLRKLMDNEEFEKLKTFNVFKLLDPIPHDEEDSNYYYVCFDFVIEFFKKYSSLKDFNIPRESKIKELNQETPNSVSFISNFLNFITKTKSHNTETFTLNNKFEETQTPTNFGVINYYQPNEEEDFDLELEATHTGLIIEYNSKFYIISKHDYSELYLHKIEDVIPIYGNTIRFFKLIKDKEFEENKKRLYPLIIKWLSRRNYLQQIEK